MAGAPAYRYDYNRDYSYDYDYGYRLAPAQPRPAAPRIEVLPGRGRIQQLDPRYFVIARVLLAMVLIFMVAGFVRVNLTSAAVATSLQYEQVAADINSARAEGSALEVQASNLSNPAYVREYAVNRLGMTPPATVETLSLGTDVVALDENGSLSLSKSLAAVARR